MSSTLNTLLEREYMLGSRGNVKGSVHFVTEYSIIYVCGNVVVICDHDSKKQEFITGTHGMDTITAISLSPCRKLIAIAEKGKVGAVNIYDATSYRRKKLLKYDELGSSSIVHIAFSKDSKSCLVLGGSPEYSLILWTIEKAAKVVTSIKLATPNEKSIFQADFSPTDSSIICVSGDGILKFFRIVDHCFRPITVNLKQEPQYFTCHCWLSTGQIVVGTNKGDLLFMENFEVKSVVTADDIKPMSVSSIVSFGKGVVVGGSGTIKIYQPSEIGENSLLLSKKFIIQNDTSSVTGLTISPSGELLTLCNANNQMYSFPLSSLELLKEDENNFRPTLHSFHSLGPRGKSDITGLDSCIWKPIIATCGLDRSVRIWNYEDKNIEVSQFFDEDIYDISLHPCGLQILLCCSSSVQLCNILVNELRLEHEIGIQSCQLCCFSNGGQYFALAYNAFVQIFDSYTFESLCTLRGHSMKITSVCWKSNDTSVCTIGVDGVICTWSVPKGIRMMRKVDPTSSYRFGDIKPQFNFGFLSCTDQTIKRFDLNSVEFDAEVEIKSSASNLVLTLTQNVFFTGVTILKSPGAICAVEISPESDNKIKARKHWQCHSRPITCLHISCDGKYLFSASEDGSLNMFKLKNITGIKELDLEDIQRAANYAEEVLVSKIDMDEKSALFQQMKQEMDQLRLDSEHQLRLKDIENEEKLAKINQDYERKMISINERKSQLLRETRELKDSQAEETKERLTKHERYVANMKREHEEKMQSEAKRLAQLEADRSAWNDNWNAQNKKSLEEQAQMLKDLSNKYEEKIKAENDHCLSILNQKQEMMAHHNKSIALMEEDADDEMTQELYKYEEKLFEVQSQNKLLEQENELLNKKYDGLLKDLDEQKETIAVLKKKQLEIEETRIQLEEVLQAKKECVLEKEVIIEEKDKEIASIERKNEELKSFKFELNEQVQELKQKMEPREQEILAMKSKTKEMDFELEKVSKEHDVLDLTRKELRLKCQGMKHEMKRLDDTLDMKQKQHVQLVLDLTRAVEKIGNYEELKSTLLPLFQRYLQGDKIASSTSTSTFNGLKKHPHVHVDPYKNKEDELRAQINRLEKSIVNLKDSSQKKNKIHQLENKKLKREHSILLEEMNDLQEKIKKLDVEEEKLMQEFRERALIPV